MSMDFDKLKIAKAYNKARIWIPAAEKIWRQEISNFVPRQGAKSVLDLGTGTGRLVLFLHKLFPEAEILGVDPAKSMLAEAKKSLKNRRYKFLHGSAERIPLKDTSVDVVFASMVWHALKSRQKTTREIKRVLRPGGIVIIRQTTKEINSIIPLWDFFPEARSLVYKLVPSRKEIIAGFGRLGFKKIAWKTVKYPYAKDYNDYFKKLSLRGISILRLLPEEAVKKGLAKLKDFCKLHGREKGLYTYRDLLVFKKV